MITSCIAGLNCCLTWYKLMCYGSVWFTRHLYNSIVCLFWFHHSIKDLGFWWFDISSWSKKVAPLKIRSKPKPRPSIHIVYLLCSSYPSNSCSNLNWACGECSYHATIDVDISPMFLSLAPLLLPACGTGLGGISASLFLIQAAGQCRDICWQGFDLWLLHNLYIVYE